MATLRQINRSRKAVDLFMCIAPQSPSYRAESTDEQQSTGFGGAIRDTLGFARGEGLATGASRGNSAARLR
ncbi:MAG: hypothetical protein Q9196_002713 [Gyalolechia fulgens]